MFIKAVCIQKKSRDSEADPTPNSDLASVLVPNYLNNELRWYNISPATNGSIASLNLFFLRSLTTGDDCRIEITGSAPQYFQGEWLGRGLNDW